MQFTTLILCSLSGSAIASPAIVWKSASDSLSSVFHNSEAIHARELLAEVFDVPSDDASLAAAVFLVGRDPNGNEALSAIASSGSLPGVASTYDAAHSIHHNVWGVDSVNSVLRDVRKGLPEQNPHVLEITLSEFNRKLSSFREQSTEAEISGDGVLSHKDSVMSKANVVLVNVPSDTDSSEIDSAVVRAIAHGSIDSVVLTGIRGSEEVKEDRNLQARRRMALMQKAKNHVDSGRRRLEDQGDADDDNNAKQGDDDLAGIYYVHMTPNIFAGVLFIIFFAFVSFIGITCMGMISNSDVYVSKMPSVGREA